ncbi:hypothetical protein G9A89_022334 [Geosiphon pyriformis]|nr:hypothetical protein G9A89_022334 [Geosiphon pyriformis]
MADSLFVYTDGFLKKLESVDVRAGITVYFENINLGLKVRVSGLMFFTLAELQAVALALKCVLSLSSISLFTNSQTVLDVCKLELSLVYLNFQNWCWIEYWHMIKIVQKKNLNISWHKVKEHLDVSDNMCADVFADVASFSLWCFSSWLNKHYILAKDNIVSGNFRHFVHKIFCLFLVWHFDLHMAAGFTSRPTVGIYTYFIKALYYQLLVAVQKCLYNKYYPSVLCLYYGNIEILDYAFFCVVNNSVADQKIVDFVCDFCFAFRDEV